MDEKEVVKGAVKVPDLGVFLQVLAVAIAAGSFACFITAARAGVRGLLRLTIEGGMGAVLGVVSVAAVLYLDPNLQGGGGWRLLILSGAAGLGGAFGLRIVDVALAIARRRMGDK